MISAKLRPVRPNKDDRAIACRLNSSLVSPSSLLLTPHRLEQNNAKLPYSDPSRADPARQYKHTEPLAQTWNWPKVLQATRTSAIHAERCLPVHAGQRRQHYRPGTPSSGSFESLKARGRETGPFFEELNHRAEVTPSLNQPFFARTWLRLRPYAHSSRAPRLMRAGAIHAPQVDLPAALASWASSAVSMTRREASWRQRLPGPSQGGVRLVALRLFCRSIQTLIRGGADHD